MTYYMTSFHRVGKQVWLYSPNKLTKLTFFFPFGFSTGFLCVTATAILAPVDEAVLEPRDLPASASQVLGLKACGSFLFFCFVLLDRHLLPDENHLWLANTVNIYANADMYVNL